MQRVAARQGLNWLNFFTAAVQTGFGPYIAVYLTESGWSQTSIGVALSAGTAAALISQLPAGVIADHVDHKRGLAMVSLVLIGLAGLLLTAFPSPALVWAAQILHAAASSVLVPTIAALTLKLCGHAVFGSRLGMNTRYQSLGTAIAAGLLGLVAFYLSYRAVFALTAALVIPAVRSLWLIRQSDIVPAAGDHPSIQHPRELRPHRPWLIFKVPSLHLFAVCMLLFSLSNAAMLPLALNALAQRASGTGLAVSATIIVPQIVAAAIAPWAGSAAERFGRRPVLLAGFLVLPIRGFLLATLPGGLPLAAIQALDGISAAVLGIMVPLVAADLTRRTGYLNLAMNSIGLAGSIGATFSTTLGGLAADRFGIHIALVGLALVGLACVALAWQGLPETRPLHHVKGHATPAAA
jgi:MFS family permease